MFAVQLQMILSLPEFVITANYGLFLKDALEPLMVAICPSLHLLLYLENRLRIRPLGVVSKKLIGLRKIAYAILSCSFREAYNTSQ